MLRGVDNIESPSRYSFNFMTAMPIIRELCYFIPPSFSFLQLFHKNLCQTKWGGGAKRYARNTNTTDLLNLLLLCFPQNPPPKKRMRETGMGNVENPVSSYTYRTFK